ncbi:MAG: LysM peptidoglycan-binding domain-containing protein [Anaerolineales bacterium]|nr:LysM peptidoglycan-binding domain-containing protein [Anaerolineales bacterium]
MQKTPVQTYFHLAWVALALVLAILACQRPSASPVAPWSASNPTLIPPETAVPTYSTVYLPVVRDPGAPIYTPTPDAPHDLPSMRTEPEEYIVQAGDTLGKIAQRYGISLDALIEANELVNPNLLDVGQVLSIPPPSPDTIGPAFKIIPDSELVYGPLSVDFDTAAFVQEIGGYLAHYEEEVDGKRLNGAQILQRVATDFSVNPRLLLAVLEYQSGWVSSANPNENTLKYPMGVYEDWREGLYLQLAWAANNLNRGYYLWRVEGVNAWILLDGSVVPIDPTINAGTAGVQQMFSLLYTRQGWEAAVTDGGLFATYASMFGYPFDLAVEPLLPPTLYQPPMQLPFEPGVEWAFTGGPHGGWGDGSAWAAIDFAPGGEALGCVQSEAWVVAVADGLIVRTGQGAVVQDLDGDGVEQTGWSVLYMHIESRGRVEVGQFVRAGERIGHPSCEGGVSSGTHVHLARRYNGEWIPADQETPFVLDGWITRGLGTEYDGLLIREDETVEAWEGFYPENSIRR